MTSLRIDTRDLPRRAGLHRETVLDLANPTQMGAGVIVVPEGAPLHLDLTLEAVVEGVLVTAEATVTMAGECGHCLEAVSGPLQVQVQELFLYADQAADQDNPEDELEMLVDDYADLEPALTDAVVLALPFSRICDDTCPRLAETRTYLADPEPLDPRWSGLAALRAELD